MVLAPLLGCACGPSAVVSDGPFVQLPPTCTVLPVVDVDAAASIPDAAPGYDDELAALPVDALPARVRVDGLSPVVHDAIAWLLDVPPASLSTGDAIPADTLDAAGARGLVVRAAALRGGGVVDEAFLRRGLWRVAGCDDGLPPTLPQFAAQVLDLDAAPFDEVTSVPKAGPRRIWRSAEAGAFVAQTIVDGAVRETEALLTDRRSDGGVFFVVYDAAGARVSSSRFVDPHAGAVVDAAAPWACMQCHRSPAGGFTDVVPTSAPSGPLR